MKVKAAGIYKLYNRVTEEYYIGYSVDIFSRWGSHYTNAKIKNHSSGLEFSTPEDWIFEILEYVSLTKFKKENPDLKGKKLESSFRALLLRREKYWMSQHSKTFALNKNNKHFAQ